jgi:2,3-bisphosphoglycerate-dependent phosphoglycerate mutase
MPTLVLLRHGESAWNSENRFTGWVDVRSRDAARRRTGAVDNCFAKAVSSRPPCTRRCSVAPFGRRHGRSMRRTPRRRRSTATGGSTSAATARCRGWGEGAPAPGPATSSTSEPEPGVVVPRTESLADVVQRLLPYWEGPIADDLRRNHPVLVVAHSNSLRVLVAHLDKITQDEVLGLNIPTGTPLRYDLHEALTPGRRGGEYLEPAAAARAPARVAEQGR